MCNNNLSSPSWMVIWRKVTTVAVLFGDRTPEIRGVSQVFYAARFNRVRVLLARVSRVAGDKDNGSGIFKASNTRTFQLRFIMLKTDYRMFKEYGSNNG
jgi:hypothetical protein